MNFNTIIPDKHKFLQGLVDIAKVPERLYIRGNLPSQRIPAMAIVGTRKPTPYGREVTYRFAYDLARRGIAIISGLAFGVDSIAHQAALDAGGLTIAVLGNGIDDIYPRQHQKLAEQIIANGGAIISEYAEGATVYKTNFLARNRLISGLSDAVIVTEAASRSGSLSTVGHALEQGRDVYAVPGNITSPQSAGCNDIIKQGATPLTKLEDILGSTPSDAPKDHVLVQLIKQGVHDGDTLLRQSGLTPSEFFQAMTLLEIDKRIRSVGGNRWTTL